MQSNVSKGGSDAVAHRTQFGHREGGLSLFERRFDQADLTSPMEHVSRSTVLLRNTTKREKPVIAKISEAISALPPRRPSV